MDNAETLKERQTDDGWATKAPRGGDEDTKEGQRRDKNERKNTTKGQRREDGRTIIARRREKEEKMKLSLIHN